jgi:hypothetical protein
MGFHRYRPATCTHILTLNTVGYICALLLSRCVLASLLTFSGTALLNLPQQCNWGEGRNTVLAAKWDEIRAGGGPRVAAHIPSKMMHGIQGLHI